MTYKEKLNNKIQELIVNNKSNINHISFEDIVGLQIAIGSKLGNLGAIPMLGGMYAAKTKESEEHIYKLIYKCIMKTKPN